MARKREPLDVILSYMLHHDSTADEEDRNRKRIERDGKMMRADLRNIVEYHRKRALDAAKEAAPYVHHRLVSQQNTNIADKALLDALDKLSNDGLRALIDRFADPEGSVARKGNGATQH